MLDIKHPKVIRIMRNVKACIDDIIIGKNCFPIHNKIDICYILYTDLILSRNVQISMNHCCWLPFFLSHINFNSTFNFECFKTHFQILIVYYCLLSVSFPLLLYTVYGTRILNSTLGSVPIVAIVFTWFLAFLVLDIRMNDHNRDSSHSGVRTSS